MRIAKLPQSEIDKICAGEVIERPASVVKELIENSLDAGATRIEVRIEDGGRRLIRVSDDGAGIAPDDIERALLPHHTSKITRADDLFEKHTLGFRGEALYSTAAVSKLKLTSRFEGEEAGIELYCEAGAIVDRHRLAFNQGTTVAVSELYFNTPVRRKFLKAKSTEVSFITSMILDYALAYPGIAWHFESDRRDLVSIRGDGNILPILERVYDKDSAKDFVEVNYTHAPGIASGIDIESRAKSLSIKGYVARPHHHKTTRGGEHFFVNRRPIRNRVFFRAVDDAYREYLSPGKHPLSVLLLSVPPSEMDVNIHPSKQEVNFINTQQIYALITIGIKRALSVEAAERQAALSRELSDIVEPPLPGGEAAEDRPDPLDDQDDFQKGAVAADLTGGEGETTPPGDISIHRERMRSVPLYTQSEESPPLSRPRLTLIEGKEPPEPVPEIVGEITPIEFSDARMLGQVEKTFIVFIKNDVLYLLDQHSAHERILFEEIYRDFKMGGARPPRQALVFPILLSVREDQARALSEYLPVMNRLGFSVELFGEDTLLLREVPALLSDRVDMEVFRAMVDEFLVSGAERSYDELVKYIASTASCKSAIKAGDEVSEAEAKWLVKALAGADDSFSCPHGRPTLIKLGFDEIGRLFQR